METLIYNVLYTRADDFADYLEENDFEFKRCEDAGMYDIFKIIVLEDESEDVEDQLDDFLTRLCSDN